MPFLERNSASIYFEFLESDSLSAPVFTMINGHTRSSSDFRIMARQMHGSGISCLTFDNRSSGKSKATAPFSLADMFEDVVALWDHLKILKSDVLGISMGGFISQCLATIYPTRVGRLILVSTASDERWIQPSEGSWKLDGNEIEKKLSSYFAPGFVERNSLLFSTMVKQTRVSITESGFNERADLQRAALKAYTTPINHKAINHECLIVHGNEDRIIHVDGAKYLHREIKGSRLKILPGIGHLILAESPKDLYQVVSNFILEPRQA